MKKYILFSLLLNFAILASYKKVLNHPFKKISRCMKLQNLHNDPGIFLINNFITKQEAEHLKKIALPRMRRSTVENGQKHQGRTSSSAMFSNNEDEVVQRIAQRAASMTGYPTSHVEGLQIVCYKKGQEFKPHFDYLPEHMKKNRGSQRIMTFFIYINDLDEDAGGKTCFPELSLEVSPKKYAALFWPDVDKTGKEDSRTLHGGLPVQKGEKWAINLWVHDNPQV